MNDRVAKSHAAVRPRAAVVALNIVLVVAACAAVAALVLEYGGFKLSNRQVGYLHVVEAIVAVIFVADRLLRWALAVHRRQYVHGNWLDLAVIIAAGLAGIAAFQFRIAIVPGVPSYLLVAQAYVLLTLGIRVVSVNLRIAGSGIHPSWLLIGSFAALCLIGSGLLMLPAATPHGKPILYHDALFTAISASCVTGLVVRPTGTEFTIFGQAVILAMIQLGGLGIILFGTTLALLLGKAFSLRTSSALGQMVSADRIGGIRRLVLFILTSTFAFEAVGAVLAYPMFAAAAAEQQGGAYVANPIWASIFHSISSFCNAGFSTYDGNMMEGVRNGWGRAMRDHWQILGVMVPLIVLGGLGFPVLYDCASYVRAAASRLLVRLRAGARRPIFTGPRPRLSLHSRIVLTMTIILIFGGAAGLLLVEPRSDAPRYGAIGRTPVYNDSTRHRRDWPRMPFEQRVRQSIFQSVSARTAGYNTIDLGELTDAGKLWMCGLMIIGGSPAGTAGGMKTVTFALLLVATYCVLRQRTEVEVFRRSLLPEVLGKVVAIAVLYLALVGAITILLCVAMRTGFSLIDLFLEACSACGTVGLSTGVTPSLNLFGKSVIMAGMFVGRLGPLTMLLALTGKVRHVYYAYPRESVAIG